MNKLGQFYLGNICWLWSFACTGTNTAALEYIAWTLTLGITDAVADFFRSLHDTAALGSIDNRHILNHTSFEPHFIQNQNTLDKD